jgi:hypothetical protein
MAIASFVIHNLGWQAVRGLGIIAQVDCRCKMRPIDSQSLARYSFVLPFWALSIGLPRTGLSRAFAGAKGISPQLTSYEARCCAAPESICLNNILHENRMAASSEPDIPFGPPD